jgi:DNA-binding transcriptional ArsR family regulator
MAVELITTMMRIAELDHFDNYIEEHRFIANSNIKEKLKVMRNQLTSFEKCNLDILFRKFKLNFYYLLIFISEKNIKTVKELINGLRRLKSDEYLAECFRISSHNISIDDEDETIYKEVIRNSSIEDAELFVEFKHDTKLLQTMLIEIIEKFYEKAYLKVEDWVTKEIEPILKNHNDLFNDNKIEFINIIGNGNYEAMISSGKDYKVYICYLSEFIPRCLFDKNKYSFVYGFGEEQKLHLKDDNINPLEIFKTLSDETRVRILSLLSQKKWERKDLVREVGLTSATMTYQLNKLIQLGLIEISVGGDRNKALYTLNRESFKVLINNSVDKIIL